MRIIYLGLFLAAAVLLMAPTSGCDRSGQFDKLNTDKDTKHLTADEVPEGKRARVEHLLELAGKNKDGTLTRQEFEDALKKEGAPWYLIALIVLAVVAVPFYLGTTMAKWLRMPDFGWKFGLILFTLVAGVTISSIAIATKRGPKFGIDLSGGVILVYEINEGATLQRQALTSDDGNEKKEQQEESSWWKRTWKWLWPSERVEKVEGPNVGDLVRAIQRRINPGGVKEIVVRPYGARQVEIIIPKVEADEIEQIKRTIRTSGFLEFLIVANPRDHGALITRATASDADPDATVIRDGRRIIGRWVKVAREEKPDRQGLRKYRAVSPGDTFRGKILDEMTGESKTRVIDIPDPVRRAIGNEQTTLGAVFQQMGVKDPEVLMVVNPDPKRNVTGGHLRSARRGFRDLTPCVNFQMTSAGAGLMGRLTGQNLPDPNTKHKRRLGIVMDNELLSAPNIQGRITSNGEITGDFTQEEVDFLVGILKAGRLPAVLREVPISENRVSALLGADTIRRGQIAIAISLVAVLAFMLVYYRFSGVTACLAVLVNLLLILALMILVNAAFTLPGLAGLVLTVGMSVDANVLIFERIREEMDRGAGLRMAIRNGFARATTTIVDANLTTLITAIVLYAIGTDQVRGFAVTLILGILMSMYTAIFCSHVVFNVAERKRWITKLRMMRILTNPHIDFIGKRKICAAASISLIVIGMIGVYFRGKQIFDVDFNGGTSVEIMLNEHIPIDRVRAELSEDFKGYSPAVTEVQFTRQQQAKGKAAYVYKIDTSITGEESEFVLPQALGVDVAAAAARARVEKVVPKSPAAKIGLQPGDVIVAAADEQTVAREDFDEINSGKALGKFLLGRKKGARIKLIVRHGNQERRVTVTLSDFPSGVDIVEQRLENIFQDKIVRHVMKIAALKPIPTEGKSPTTETKTDALDKAAAGNRAVPTPHTRPTDLPTETMVATAGDNVLQLVRADPPLPADSTSGASTPSAGSEKAGGADESESTQPEAKMTPTADLRTKTTIEFDHVVNAQTLRGMIEDQFPEQGAPKMVLANDQWDGESSKGYPKWDLTIALKPEDAQVVLDRVKQQFGVTPVWPSSSKIGGTVADKTKNMAIAALLASLLGIIGYIWFRFQKVVFGLAAVVALVHDVLITLGALAVSLWLAKVFGFLLIEEFKINLPIVAAFLTIIGYSLNDTIVVFDRIREVRGKSPGLTVDMLNQSINQTLSRTLLTSLTTLLVVVILYCFGGQGIHGFAFALLVGVAVGTYSSIYVASPVLLWMAQPHDARPKGKRSVAQAG